MYLAIKKKYLVIVILLHCMQFFKVTIFKFYSLKIYVEDNMFNNEYDIVIGQLGSLAYFPKVS